MAYEKIVIYLKERNVQEIIAARFDTRSSYNKKIVTLYKENRIRLTFSDPKGEKALQIADFYSWIIFCYLEKHNSQYYLKLKHQIEIVLYNNAPEERVNYHEDRSPSGD